MRPKSGRVRLRARPRHGSTSRYDQRDGAGLNTARPRAASRPVPGRASEAVERWRRTILERSLWVALAVLAIAMVAVVVQGHAPGPKIALSLGPGFCLVALGLATTNAPTPRRAAFLILGFLAAVFGVALDRGFLIPNLLVGGLMVCVLAAVVASRVVAWLTVVGLIGMWTVVGLVFLFGKPVPVDAFIDIQIGANWVRILGVYLALVCATVAIVVFIVSRLERAIEHSEALYDALVQQTTDKIEAQREQQALERQLGHAQRLDALGRLAGGIAHDFNNLLMVVLNSAQAAADRDTTELERSHAHGDIVTAAEKGASLTRQLLAFSRQNEIESGHIDVESAARSTIGMLQRLLPDPITLHTQLEEGLPDVWGPPNAVEQIMVNVCVNARDAMPQGGEFFVTVTRLDCDQVPGNSGPGEPRRGEFVRIRMRDTGTGIAEDVLPRVFEPFFTTKAPQDGTGLGLSLVYGLARQCGGWADLDSEHSVGTTVDVYLAAHADTERGHHDVPTQHCGNEGTVLVVDDDDTVRLALVRALRRAGFDVLDAADGEAGWELFQRTKSRIEVVVSDGVMPGMSGQLMLERMLQAKPSLRCLVCSGYASETFRPGFFKDSRLGFLGKPFRLEELIGRVTSLVGR